MIIGEWYEAEPREIRRNHTSYAADWEKVITRPGFYPVKLSTRSGYAWSEKRERDAWLAYATDPALGLIGDVTPSEAVIVIDADRVDGRTYSGFGGLNFASREEPLGFAPYHIRVDGYGLPALIDQGTITLNESSARALRPHLIKWRAFNETQAIKNRERREIDACMSRFDALSACMSIRYASESCEREGDADIIPADGKPNLASAMRIADNARITYKASDRGRRTEYLSVARMLPREVLRRLADGETVNQIDPGSRQWRF